MTSPYYVPSGRMGPCSVLLACACAVLLLPMAWAYAWLTWKIGVPFNFLVPLLTAYGVLGPLSVALCRRARIRNPRRMGRIGLALGGWFWYCQWAAWAALALHDTGGRPPAHSVLAAFAQLAFDPLAIGDVAWDWANEAVETLEGWRPGGAWLALWAIECLMLLGVARRAGRQAADAIFCEQSLSWASDIVLEGQFKYIDDDETVRRMLEAQPQRFLSVLAPWSPTGPASFAQVTIHACQGDDCYVSLENLHTMGGEESNAFGLLPVVERLRLPRVDSRDLARQLAALGYTEPETVGGSP